jgi:2-hydroxyisobutanoyl-CoA mutase large subunit
LGFSELTGGTPTEESARLALRTQQIIAHETRVPDVIDPLGGSYFLENLTTQYERAIFDILGEVDAKGGTIKLINEGWFQRHIADFAYEVAIRKQDGDHPVIGVNCYVEDEEEHDIELHPYDPMTAERQIARLNHVRATRDEAKVQALLGRLKEVARNKDENIVPITVELVREGASMGDIVETLKTVWGTYRETPVF